MVGTGRLGDGCSSPGGRPRGPWGEVTAVSVEQGEVTAISVERGEVKKAAES